MGHRIVTAVLGLVCTAGMAAGQTDSWYGRNPRLSVQSLQAPDGRFTLQYPKKDWLAVPGGGGVLLTLTERRVEATVAVEDKALNQPLAPDDITDLFAQLEIDAIKERQPKATDFQSRLLEAEGRKIVIVQFTRPGLKGPERVRQFSIPAGPHLYRVVCSSSPAQFAKYEPVFAHIAASFRPAQE